MSGPLKPAHWGFNAGLVAPKWQWVWRDLVLAVPLWEGGGNNVFDVVNRQLHPVDFAAGSWSTDERGIALDFPNANDNIDLGSPSYLNLTDPLTVVYAGTSNLTSGSTRHITGFYQSGGAFPGWAAVIRSASDTMQFWDGNTWRNSNVAVSGGFQVLGYTHTGPTIEFYIDGVNVFSDTGAVFAISSFTGTKVLFNQSNKVNALRAKASAFFLWKRILTDAEHSQIAKDPYGPFRMRDDVGVVQAGVGIGTILEIIRITSEITRLRTSIRSIERLKTSARSIEQQLDITREL